ncbi:hypothetical protein NL337_26715, partial [Klebsiella pneumoniae]|nr:hypothetical protein [Klebsiella pneumoniae]
VMPDFSPGKGLSIEGSGIVRHGRINVHNLYGGSIVATANRQEFSVFSDDQRWSLDGYRYGGPVQAPDFVVDGLGSFGFRRWAQSG